MGLLSGGSLSEIFPGLQVLFFPAMPRQSNGWKSRETKVFPEPIDGDALLGAIERAEKASAGAPDLFHIIDVVQMCCLGRRSGAIQVVKEKRSGILFLRSGQIVACRDDGCARHSRLIRDDRMEVYRICLRSNQFVRRSKQLRLAWDEALIEAVTLHKQHKTMASHRQRA